jgi:hypothetical protein
MNTLIRITLFLMIPGSSIILVVWLLSRLHCGTKDLAT